ncbi:hypothetical protein G9A89_004074 [Geosiphon pyriformis]|nr:hypothetical protein G9A89_004074 [Geosiphon pyriformis]
MEKYKCEENKIERFHISDNSGRYSEEDSKCLSDHGGNGKLDVNPSNLDKVGYQMTNLRSVHDGNNLKDNNFLGIITIREVNYLLVREQWQIFVISNATSQNPLLPISPIVKIIIYYEIPIPKNKIFKDKNFR